MPRVLNLANVLQLVIDLPVRPNLEVNPRLRYALGLKERANIITERVDDSPLWLEQMQRMELPTLIDTHFSAHGNWSGRSLGWVSPIWLRSILSRGDHRLVHVEPWVANRLVTLQTVTGQAVERLDVTDERLESVLRRLSDEARWAQCESRRNQHTGRVDDLRPERRHVASTTASAYASVNEGGCFQFGHRKDYRPDVPPVKGMQAVLEPLGMPLATAVVSGERADDPLFVPCSERGQQRVGRCGLLFVGDCKLAAHDTRACRALAGDDYLGPLPQIQLGERECAAALEGVWSSEHALTSVCREPEPGKPEVMAQGDESAVPMRVAVKGKWQEGTERRLVVRSVRQAQAAAAALRARVAKAKAQVEALSLRGRGRKRFAELETLRQAVHEIVQRHRVEDCLWLRYDHHTTTRSVRAYRERLA